MTLIILLILEILPYCFSETWTVYVHTGNERFAGTDSNVYIRLFNEEGDSTSEIQLTHYNWLPNNNDFPIRNLFETGAKERFRIQTEYIGSVSKIDIRHNNFPVVHADWLLDQVIIERNRDDAKYKFNCNCWLRGSKPHIIIPVFSDQRTDQNKNKDLSSRNNRAFVIILVVLITLVICIFCCFNQYRRRQRHRSISLTDTIEQIQQEPPLLDAYNSSSLSPSSGPQIWINTMRRWKNFRNGLPSYNHTQTTQSTTSAPVLESTIVPGDEPPAYEDLYPNATVSINTVLSSNV